MLHPIQRLSSWSFLVLEVPSVSETGAIVVNFRVYASIIPFASTDFRGC
jgi:hypothetical protein